MNTLLLATNNGLVRAVKENGEWVAAGRSLANQTVTSVIAREGVILVGTRQGVQRSDDGGESWRKSDNLGVRHVRWLAYHPDISDREFAGTEPAGLFVSADGAETWQEAAKVAQLRDQHHWFLPYSPEAGCVRGFAFHGKRLYAAVEVGGVLRSDDGGATWDLAPGSDGNPRFGRPAPGRVHPDVHSILVHPSDRDQVLAPTGGGLYHSADGGVTWRCLYDCYCRAAWWDPADVRHIIFGPAGSVDRQGRIEESHDGGQSWQPASEGLDTPWPRHMVERFTVDEASSAVSLLAILSNGDLTTTRLAERNWTPMLAGSGRVNALSCFQM